MDLYSCVLELNCHAYWGVHYCLTRIDILKHMCLPNVNALRKAFLGLERSRDTIAVETVAVLTETPLYSLIYTHISNCGLFNSMKELITGEEGMANIVQMLVSDELLCFSDLIDVIDDKTIEGDYNNDVALQKVSGSLASVSPFYLGAHVLVLRALLQGYCNTFYFESCIPAGGPVPSVLGIEDAVTSWFVSSLPLTARVFPTDLGEDVFCNAVADGRAVNALINSHYPNIFSKCSKDLLETSGETTETIWAKNIKASEEIDLWVGFNAREAAAEATQALRLHTFRYVEELLVILTGHSNDRDSRLCIQDGYSHRSSAHSEFELILKGGCGVAPRMADSERASLTSSGKVADRSESRFSLPTNYEDERQQWAVGFVRTASTSINGMSVERNKENIPINQTHADGVAKPCTNMIKCQDADGASIDANERKECCEKQELIMKVKKQQCLIDELLKKLEGEKQAYKIFPPESADETKIFIEMSPVRQRSKSKTNAQNSSGKQEIEIAQSGLVHEYGKTPVVGGRSPFCLQRRKNGALSHQAAQHLRNPSTARAGSSTVRSGNRDTITLALRYTLFPNATDFLQLSAAIASLDAASSVVSTVELAMPICYLILLKGEAQHTFKGLYIHRGGNTIYRIYGSGPQQAVLSEKKTRPNIEKGEMQVFSPKFLKYNITKKSFEPLSTTTVSTVTDAVILTKANF